MKAKLCYDKCLEYRKYLSAKIKIIYSHAESINQKVLIWGCNQNFVRLLTAIDASNPNYDVVDSANQKQVLKYFKNVILDPSEIVLDRYAAVFICATSAYVQIKNLILNNSSLSEECLHRVDFSNFEISS